MATQTSNTTIFTLTHPDIVKRTSVASLLYSGVMVLLGIFLFVAVFGMTDNTSTASMTLMVCGTVLILGGIFRIFWKSKQLIYLPTGSVATERSLFFDLKYLNRLTDMLDNLSVEVAGVKSGASGNVRMDVMITKDSKFVAVQLFQFVPYTYTPVTKVKYFTGTEAAALSTFISKM